MTRKQRRLTMIGGAGVVLVIAAALVLNALRDSIVFFSTPQMVAEHPVPPGKRFRLGGVVETGSLQRGDKLAVSFVVADGSAKVPVSYQAFCPTCSAKGRAWSPKARSTLPVCSRPTPCSPSMTRPTCRAKLPIA